MPSPARTRRCSLFTLAATELTNLWLLTGLGTYVLYRPAPNPASWSLLARSRSSPPRCVVWALPLLLERARQPLRAALCYWVLIQMVPPMLLSFIVPITDRYLFLPSIGVCLLLMDLAFRGRASVHRAQLAEGVAILGLARTLALPG